MSTRRKFIIILNLLALVIAALLLTLQLRIHHHASVASSLATNHAVEMQLLALPVFITHPACANSCVITSRAALGIKY